MPDQTENGSPPAQPGAPQPPAATNSNRKLWIVIIVLVVSLLCFCGVAGGLLLAGSLLDEDAQDSTGETEQETTSAQEDADEAADDAPATLDEVRAEAERMIVAFYPDCELKSMSEVTES